MNTVTPSRVSGAIHLYHKDYLEHYKMESALMKINNRPNGKRLIDKITKLAGEDKVIKVRIDYSIPSLSFGELTPEQKVKYQFDDDDFFDNVRIAEAISHKKGFMRKGEGVGGQIFWNPKKSIDQKTGNLKTDEWERESFTSLAHEMVHSMRMLNGTSKSNNFQQFSNRDGINEEKRAVGIGRYSFKRISENGIRAEQHLPRRTTY